MASLTQTAIIARKVIRYGIYAIVTIITIRYTYLLGRNIYKHYFPEPPPPPEVKFSKVPELPFPQKGSYEDLTLILETPEGGLPSLQPQANVYVMPKPASNIRALERAKQKAQKLDFDPDGRELSNSVYIFDHKTNPSSLTMNIITDVFSISYDLSADPTIITKQTPPADAAIQASRSYIANAGLLPTDISGRNEFEYLKVQNGEFVGTISLSEADFIKTNLFRTDYDEKPSMTPDPLEANIWFIVGAQTRRGSTILVAEYKYFPVDETKFSTYPIKSSQQAWDELVSGQGFIARRGKNPQGAQIRIRRVYLGYYDAGEYMEFYQPIVVFEGDNEFFAYVPAVTSEYYGESEEATPESSE